MWMPITEVQDYLLLLKEQEEGKDSEPLLREKPQTFEDVFRIGNPLK